MRSHSLTIGTTAPADLAKFWEKLARQAGQILENERHGWVGEVLIEISEPTCIELGGPSDIFSRQTWFRLTLVPYAKRYLRLLFEDNNVQTGWMKVAIKTGEVSDLEIQVEWLRITRAAITRSRQYAETKDAPLDVVWRDERGNSTVTPPWRRQREA